MINRLAFLVKSFYNYQAPIFSVMLLRNGLNLHALVPSSNEEAGRRESSFGFFVGFWFLEFLFRDSVGYIMKATV